MIDLQCPMCGAVIGAAERSPEALVEAYNASIRVGKDPTEEDYERSRAIVREQNRQRDVLQAHLKAAHPQEAAFPYLYRERR